MIFNKQNALSQYRTPVCGFVETEAEEVVCQSTGEFTDGNAGSFDINQW